MIANSPSAPRPDEDSVMSEPDNKRPSTPGPNRRPDPACDYVLREVQAERVRAHAKHGDTSMESLGVDDLTRLTVLMEEVGEVAREFNEARHRAHRFGWDIADAFGPEEHASLRAELIQVAAMATAWADALTRESANGDHGHA